MALIPLDEDRFLAENLLIFLSLFLPVLRL